ncbi:hypothetical protein BMS3Abin04_01621 [bacterium BMS3Abin04]|nr:hypothetical protein BMS3Abin04_01621 [bacterium BMS3Abin04]
MKKIIKLLFPVLIFMASNLIAQNMHQNFPPFFRGKAKLQELEKIKLIESLNLDENVTLRFFARKNKFQNKQETLTKEKDSLLNSLNSTFNSGENKSDKYYDEIVRKVSKVDREMLNNREKFVKSLYNILSPKQIAKFIVFEFRFRKEIRNFFLNRKHRMLKR